MRREYIFWLNYVVRAFDLKLFFFFFGGGGGGVVVVVVLIQNNTIQYEQDNTVNDAIQNYTDIVELYG